MKKFSKSSLILVLTFTMLLSPLTTLGAPSTPGAVGDPTSQDQPIENKISDWKILEAGEVSKRIDALTKGKAGAALDDFLRNSQRRRWR
jgi:hypothetical protein